MSQWTSAKARPRSAALLRAILIVAFVSAWLLAALKRAPSYDVLAMEIVSGAICGALLGLGIAHLWFGFVEGSGHSRTVKRGGSYGAMCAIMIFAVIGPFGEVAEMMLIAAGAVWVIGATLFRFFGTK